MVVVYIVLAAILSLSQVLQKELMDYQYISPFTLIMGIGIFSTLFTLLALTITTNVKCNEKLIGIGVCTSVGSDQNSFYFDSLQHLEIIC